MIFLFTVYRNFEEKISYYHNNIFKQIGNYHTELLLTHYQRIHKIILC